MIRFLYNLLFPFVFLCLLPGFVIRMLRRGKYRHKFGQRFGIYSQRVQSRFIPHQWIWVHAVSVGEVLIALKLIRAMRADDPTLKFALSTTTSTGFALASNNKSDWLEPIYNPIDLPWIVRRALRLIRPVQLILVEAEVWPNLTTLARQDGASVVLANARLSQRSEHRYRRFKSITGPFFRQLDAICVPESEDVARWQRLGVDPDCIHVTGSIKFDDSAETVRKRADFRPLLAQIGVSESTPVLLGGSTHSGEELLLAEVFRTLRTTYPDLLLILVPRHAERSAVLCEELQAAGYAVNLRSQLESLRERPDILLVDTTGELRSWYTCATVVFVGKSLTAKGGQNPAEALAAGKPVLFGPRMDNFTPLVRGLLDNGGAIEVQNVDDLTNRVSALLGDPSTRRQLVEAGQQVVARHQGAAVKTAELLARVRRGSA